MPRFSQERLALAYSGCLRSMLFGLVMRYFGMHPRIALMFCYFYYWLLLILRTLLDVEPMAADLAQI